MLFKGISFIYMTNNLSIKDYILLFFDENDIEEIFPKSTIKSAILNKIDILQYTDEYISELKRLASIYINDHDKFMLHLKGTDNCAAQLYTGILRGYFDSFIKEHVLALNNLRMLLSDSNIDNSQPEKITQYVNKRIIGKYSMHELLNENLDLIENLPKAKVSNKPGPKNKIVAERKYSEHLHEMKMNWMLYRNASKAAKLIVDKYYTNKAKEYQVSIRKQLERSLAIKMQHREM